MFHECYLSGEDHLDTARAYYGLGCALGALGSIDEALENLNKACRIQHHVLASKHEIEKTKKEIKVLSFNFKDKFFLREGHTLKTDTFKSH